MDRFFEEIFGGPMPKDDLTRRSGSRFSGPVRMLIGNLGLFQPYSDELNGEASAGDY